MLAAAPRSPLSPLSPLGPRSPGRRKEPELLGLAGWEIPKILVNVSCGLLVLEFLTAYPIKGNKTLYFGMEFPIWGWNSRFGGGNPHLGLKTSRLEVRDGDVASQIPEEAPSSYPWKRVVPGGQEQLDKHSHPSISQE